MSEVKLPGEAKQNNVPPECEQPIDGGFTHLQNLLTDALDQCKTLTIEKITGFKMIPDRMTYEAPLAVSCISIVQGLLAVERQV
jgi:hypothetical protein